MTDPAPSSPSAIGGKSHPLKRRSTLADLARELKVDASTVSLGLRDSPKISLATKKKIRDCARRRGYVANAHARALVGGKSGLLGVIIPCAGLPIYSAMLDLIFNKAALHGYRAEVQFHNWDQEREILAIRTMMEHRAEGIVAFSGLESPAKFLQNELFLDDGIPISLWGPPPADFRKPNEFIRGFVTTDVQLGARLAAEHLLDLGHRRIALLLPSLTWSAHEKLLGIQKAIERYPDAKLILVDLLSSFRSRGSGAQITFEVGECMAQQFVKLDPLPTAVLTTDDTGAQVLLSVLHHKGVRVPEDVSVVCSGNTYYSEFGSIPITTIDTPLKLISERLVDLVIQPAGTIDPRDNVFPPRLITRSSTAAISSQAASRRDPNRKGARRDRADSFAS